MATADFERLADRCAALVGAVVGADALLALGQPAEAHATIEAAMRAHGLTPWADDRTLRRRPA